MNCAQFSEKKLPDFLDLILFVFVFVFELESNHWIVGNHFVVSVRPKGRAHPPLFNSVAGQQFTMADVK